MTKAKEPLALLLAVVSLGGACGGGTTREVCSDANCDGVCANGRCLTTLASGAQLLGALALDGTNVYVASFGIPNASAMGITKIPKLGGTPTTIASDTEWPNAIAIDGTSVYWTSFGPTTFNMLPNVGWLKSSLLAGAGAASLATGLFSPEGVAVDAHGIYWAEYGQISRIPLAGGTPTVLASGQNRIGPIAIDANNLYWVDNFNDARLMTMPIGGGTPSALATAGTHASDSELAIHADHAYWTISVYSVVDGTTTYTVGKVLSVPLRGGCPTTLASGQNGPDAITVDATAVYWINDGSHFTTKDDGAVMKVPLAGGTPVTLAANRPSPGNIAVDATSVYWEDWSGGVGSVMKTPKD